MSSYKTFRNLEDAVAFFTQCVMDNREPKMEFDPEFVQWGVWANPV